MMASLSVNAYADDIKAAFSQIGQESDWRTANTDTIECTPLYGPFVEKTIVHPEEGVYDCVGGIDLGTVTVNMKRKPAR